MNLREEGEGIFLHTLACFPFTEYEFGLILQDEKKEEIEKFNIYSQTSHICFPC